MNQDREEQEEPLDQESVARLALQRVNREERLLAKAEGKLWLRVLPLLALLVTGVLWIIPVLRPMLAVCWIFLPLALLQVGLLTTGSRIDAVLALLTERERSRGA